MLVVSKYAFTKKSNYLKTDSPFYIYIKLFELKEDVQ